jgi:hypothetical protein
MVVQQETNFAAFRHARSSSTLKLIELEPIQHILTMDQLIKITHILQKRLERLSALPSMDII